MHVPSTAFRGSEFDGSTKAQCFHIRQFPDVLLLDVNACSSNRTVKITGDGGFLFVQPGNRIFWGKDKYEASAPKLVPTSPVLIKPYMYCAAENEKMAHQYYRGGFIESKFFVAQDSRAILRPGNSLSRAGNIACRHIWRRPLLGLSPRTSSRAKMQNSAACGILR